MFAESLYHCYNHQYFYNMQQLDLFGNPIAIQPVKAAEKKAVDAIVEELQAEQKKKAPVAEETKPVEEIETPVEKKAVENISSTSGKRGRKSFKDMDADIVMVDVPEDEILFQKQYYSISEVAKWFHVNQSLIRFWENEFEILKPRKTRKGDRLFRPEDVKNIQLIYHLLRQRKFSIEGARQYLKDNKKKNQNDLFGDHFRGCYPDIKNPHWIEQVDCPVKDGGTLVFYFSYFWEQGGVTEEVGKWVDCVKRISLQARADDTFIVYLNRDLGDSNSAYTEFKQRIRVRPDTLEVISSEKCNHKYQSWSGLEEWLTQGIVPKARPKKRTDLHYEILRVDWRHYEDAGTNTPI